MDGPIYGRRGSQSSIVNFQSAITSGYRVRTHAKGSLCARRNPANLRAIKSVLGLDGRRRSHQTDQMSLARASSRYAKRQLPWVREHQLRLVIPSALYGDT